MADKTPEALADMADDIFDPAAVIATAKRSLKVLDQKLIDAQMRRDEANAEIKTLRTQREQMVRIAGADTKRTITRAPRATATAAATPPPT